MNSLVTVCLFLAAVSVSTNSASGVRRLGCFRDTFFPGQSRDLPESMRARGRTTKQYCLNYCRSKGFGYVGLQAGDWCHCGNTYGRYGRVSDSECNKECHGDRSTTCGGSWRNEIFTTGLTADGIRLGCFKDQISPRDLSETLLAESRTTKQYCLMYCQIKGFKYVGLQAGQWCYCGHTYGRYGRVNDSECNTECHGDRSTTCGGSWRNEIFTTGLTASDGIRLGCFKDQNSPRDLPETLLAGSRATKHYCLNYCRLKGFRYVSLQAGDWCHCGHTYGRYGRVSDSECNKECHGDRGATCGGSWRNEIFTTGLTASDGIRLGCFKDQNSPRDLPETLLAGSRTTKQYCLNYCRWKGFRYVSLQAGQWCHCGNTYGRYGNVSDSECNGECHGDRSTTCGGDWRNEIFTTGLFGFKSIGCFVDSEEQRDFPLLAESSRNMTLLKCNAICKSKGFEYFGAQGGKHCYCGNQYGIHGEASSKSKCSTPCAGDADEMCGGNGHNSVFSVVV